VTTGFRIEALTAAHDRERFSSGAAPLDRYLRELATQDIRRRLSHCFVALGDADVVAGYYTFAATSLPMTELAADEARRLPRYPLLPAGLIGRLAVDRRFQGRGLGGALILDAAARASRADFAVFALIVDAKDDAALAFYEHLGFRRFTSRPVSLFLPLATALKALDTKGEG
jgi:ribosomal protein S18 acetylase RimI-like enzyme